MIVEKACQGLEVMLIYWQLNLQDFYTLFKTGSAAIQLDDHIVGCLLEAGVFPLVNDGDN